MITVALSLLAGIFLVQCLPFLPNDYCLVAGGIVAGIMAWLRYWRVVFFVLGMVWAVLFALMQLNDRLPAELEGVELPITGIVSSLPRVDERRVSFDFTVLTAASSVPKQLKLSWYTPTHIIKAGEHWAFTVKLKQPHGNFNASGLDYERLLLTQGIGATGYVRLQPTPVLLGRDSAWVSIAVWRQTITDKLSALLPDSPSLGLIKALTIGDGNGISQAQWEVFRQTGTTHLVVISGSHIGLVAGLVYVLVLKIWAWTGILRWSPQRVAALVAVLIGCFYAALAGFFVPTQRAVIMLAVAMLAISSQRNTRPFQSLAIALCVVLLVNPLAVLATGFWLSFIAVALIIYTVSGRLGKLSVMWEMLKLNALMSLSLAPLTLLFFQQLSLISPVANVIAVPVISFLVVPFALVGVLLLFVSSTVASGLFWLVDAVLQPLQAFLNSVAALPFAVLNHAQPSPWATLFAGCAVLLLCAPKGMPARPLGAVLLLPLLFSDVKRPANGEIMLTLLDVGQGLSVVVQTAQHTLVYDTGSKFSEDSDSGKSVLLPFLHQQGIARIDQLMISHGDNDHIGGAKSVLHGLPVAQILTSVPEKLSVYQPAIPCIVGQSWVWDEVRFTVLSPADYIADANNDNSCVLQVQTRDGAVLLTGDIEARAEAWLVAQYGNDLKAEILIAPHHGSKTSSSRAFLQAIQPRTVLIPAGYRNSFGHPHAEVLARYRDLNAQWLSSAESGAITVTNDKGVWTVSGLRQTQSHYWNYRALQTHE